MELIEVYFHKRKQSDGRVYFSRLRWIWLNSQQIFCFFFTRLEYEHIRKNILINLYYSYASCISDIPHVFKFKQFYYQVRDNCALLARVMYFCKDTDLDILTTWRDGEFKFCYWKLVAENAFTADRRLVNGRVPAQVYCIIKDNEVLYLQSELAFGGNGLGQKLLRNWSLIVAGVDCDCAYLKVDAYQRCVLNHFVFFPAKKDHSISFF